MMLIGLSLVRQLLLFAIHLLTLLIVAEVVGSWLILFGLVKATHPMVRLVRTIVAPFLRPLRTLLPPGKTKGWDFSPVLAILLLEFLAGIVSRW